MKKRILFLSLCMLATSTLVNAADINIPGADPSIKTDEYTRYTHVTPETNAFIEKDKATRTSAVLEAYAENKRREAEAWTKRMAEQEPAMPDSGDGLGSDYNEAHSEPKQSEEEVLAERVSNTFLAFKGKTIIVNEMTNGRMMMTLPFSTFSRSPGLMTDDKRIVFGVEGVAYTALLMVQPTAYEYSFRYMGKPHKSINTTDFISQYKMLPIANQSYQLQKDTMQGHTFEYKGLDKPAWSQFSLRNEKKNTITDASNIGFALQGEPDLQYDLMIFFQKDNPYGESLDNLNSMMANYIVPSIRPVKSISSYSEAKSLGNFSFNILKNSKEDQANSPVMKAYTSSDHIIQVVRVRPIVDRDPSDPYDIDVMLSELDKVAGPIGPKPISVNYTVVWNNFVPGILFDFEYDFGMRILYYVVRDSKNIYSMKVTYDVNHSSYTKAQITDMVVLGSLIDIENTQQSMVNLMPTLDEVN